MIPYVDIEGTLHETYTAQITINGQHLGEITYDSGREDLRWRRDGYAFFCSDCGEIWARLTVKNSKGELQAYGICEVSCAKHPDLWNIPGSILTNNLIHLLDQMPLAVVKQEFNLLLAQANAQ